MTSHLGPLFLQNATLLSHDLEICFLPGIGGEGHCLDVLLNSVLDFLIIVIALVLEALQRIFLLQLLLSLDLLDDYYFL